MNTITKHTGILALFTALCTGCSPASPDTRAQRVELPHEPDAHIFDWSPSCPLNGSWTMAMHGGAGVILKKNFTAEREQAYREALSSTLEAGAEMLRNGASALDVVETSVRKMENDPKFNAGKGAVFSAAGMNELDAAIMDGRDRNAGTVASVKRIKNPISLARSVMENSRHVMLISEGAETFAEQQGIEMVDPAYFYTQKRWEQMQAKMAKKQGSLIPATKFGTVGVVIKDGCGNLAAGTSTGGLTAKEWGRVGDTPIIGAGTYADNRYCAVSATGTGEYFIRATIARDVCARREFAGEDLQTAMDAIIHGTLTDMGGDGGIVAIDNEGNFAFSFNTKGMYRGAVRHDAPVLVKIYK
ncbi:MAG: isoaspartyl peptidase/L-asparaginase [Robiginitomaculum sp.]|nr:MAG: isoaspartyl peptidase/L-asparaginase [Robiginitomaculum sp.]